MAEMRYDVMSQMSNAQIGRVVLHSFLANKIR